MALFDRRKPPGRSIASTFASASASGSVVAVPNRETEVRLVEANRAVQITDREVNRPDVRRRIDHREAEVCAGFSASSRSTSAVMSWSVSSWNLPLALPAKPAWALRTRPSRPRKKVVGKELRFTPCGTLVFRSFGSPGSSTPGLRCPTSVLPRRHGFEVIGFTTRGHPRTVPFYMGARFKQ